MGRTQPVPLYVVNPSEPVLMEANRERFIAMDRMFVPSDDAFFLRVEDDGMIDRGIQRGDLVLVNPAARAHDGDAVVARVNDQVMVRLLSHRGANSCSPRRGPSRKSVGPMDDFDAGTVAVCDL
jgi:SOS-response transcriptional repressor LexA